MFLPAELERKAKLLQFYVCCLVKISMVVVTIMQFCTVISFGLANGSSKTSDCHLVSDSVCHPVQFSSAKRSKQASKQAIKTFQHIICALFNVAPIYKLSDPINMEYYVCHDNGQ